MRKITILLIFFILTNFIFITDIEASDKNSQTLIISQAILNDLESIKSSNDLVFNKHIKNAMVLPKEDKVFVFIPFFLAEKNYMHISSLTSAHNYIDINHLVGGFSLATNNLIETKSIAFSQDLISFFAETGNSSYESSNIFNNTTYSAFGKNNYLGTGLIISLEMIGRERISSVYSDIMFKVGSINKELNSSSTYIPICYNDWNYYTNFSSKIGYIHNLMSDMSLDLFLAFHWACLQSSDISIDGYLFKVNNVYSRRPAIGLKINKDFYLFPAILTPHFQVLAEYEYDSVVVSSNIMESSTNEANITAELGLSFLYNKYSPFSMMTAFNFSYGEIKKSLGIQIQAEYEF